MFRSGLVDTLVTHANIKGFGLTPLSGDRRGYMPPLLKTKFKTKPFLLRQEQNRQLQLIWHNAGHDFCSLGVDSIMRLTWLLSFPGCDEKKIKCTLKLASQLSSRTISLKNHHWLNDMLSKELVCFQNLKNLNGRNF